MYSLFLYSYANQMGVGYNVQCETGKLVSSSLHLEPNNCPDGTTMRCMLLKKKKISVAGFIFQLTYTDAKTTQRLILVQENIGSSVETVYPVNPLQYNFFVKNSFHFKNEDQFLQQLFWFSDIASVSKEKVIIAQYCFHAYFIIIIIVYGQTRTVEQYQID